jgi:transmembrane sensor
MNPHSYQDTLRIAEQAAEWLHALEAGEGDVQNAFADWLRASPRHVEEFLLLTASEQATNGIDAGHTIDIDQLIAELPHNVFPLQGADARPAATVAEVPAAMRRRPARSVRWAAGVAIASVGLLLLWMASTGELSGWHSYGTAVGEQRSVTLEDGSLIELAAHSRLQVNLSAQRRDIRLQYGEALFKVARDPSRPFQVHAGETVVRAVGTQFNVNRSVGNTTVAVAEGRVQILSATEEASSTGAKGNPDELLGAGEMARIAPTGTITREHVDLADVAVWRQRRLVFRDSTLGEIADTFNRYSRTPQILVEDPALRARRFGGTFDADNPEALIKFLRAEPGLICETQGTTLSIRPAPAP